MSLARRLSIAGLIGLSLAACTTARPVPVGHETKTQQELHSLSHWKVLAGNLADRVAARSTEEVRAGGVFVEPIDDQVEFTRVLHSELTGALTSRGTVVTMARGGSRARLVTSVEVVEHSHPWDVPPGAIALIGGVLWAAKELDAQAVTTGAWAERAGDAMRVGLLDAAVSGLASARKRLAEVVVTTTLVDDSQIFARDSAVYYIAHDDIPIYKTNRPAAPLMVRGGTDNQPMPVRGFAIK
ncbi:MAG TPA: hypothetical protein VLL76_10165 [Candidatus Omnitrophota bacterium]|nr:hypothetical protein [Candidatus Omnitrophota bacterium]